MPKVDYVRTTAEGRYASLMLVGFYRGRLKHGRHFTFKSTLNESAVTLVSPSVAGAIVDGEHRFAIHGLWLQVLLDEEFIEQLSQELDCLSDAGQVSAYDAGVIGD